MKLLLAEHRVNADIAVDKYSYAYKQLDKNKPEEFYKAIPKIIKLFQREIAESGAMMFHKAITNNLPIDIDTINEVRKINIEAAERFSEEVNTP